MVDRVPVERQDLLAIWAFCTGQLCWAVDADRRRLVEVRNTLVSASERAGAMALAELMASTAPAEFACEPDKDDANTAPARDDTWLADLPAADAMRRVCDARDWTGIAKVLDRLKSERPTDASSAIELAWAALMMRPERVWWFDGASGAYRAIFPFLSSAQRWEIVGLAVKSREYDVPAYLTNTLAENLDDLCRLAAVAEGRAALSRGLRLLLDMHELWLTGAGKLSGLTPVPLARDAAPSGWRPLFTELLFHLLAFDESAYVQAALRGLHRLLILDPDLHVHVVDLLSAAEPKVRRRFLLMAEAIACQPEASVFREWLASEAGSGHIDIALSAWAALRAGCRALGDSEPDWLPPEGEMPVVVRVARPLPIRPPVRRGLVASVGRASATVLDELEEACDGDVQDLRAELAASIRDDPPTPRARKTRSVGVGDLVPDEESDAELERLFALLRVRERQGRFEGVPVPRLAQAIVPFADPFVFLRTPPPSSPTSSWPIDERLDALLRSEAMVVWGDDLAAVIAADLAPDMRLIAGVLRTFSRKWDVMVSVDHVVPLGGDRGEDVRPSILNGRASLVFEAPDVLIARPGALDQEWLTRATGGLLPLFDATLDFFPGRVWKDRLSWVPDLRDPRIWMRQGRRVAWFERITGAVRHIYPSDFVYRQPTVSRWVCTADEWNRIESLIGRPQRRIRPECAAHGEG